MKPEKALELVGRYSALTKEIKSLTKTIGESIEKCPGISGKRLLLDDFGCMVHQPEMDNKNREKDVHLWAWYQPETIDDGFMCPTLEWVQPIAEIHGVECPHCFEAHEAVQLRKLRRAELGAVKRTMTRWGSVA